MDDILEHPALDDQEESVRIAYGAEMMESSVKTISRPVIERLPVNQLDEFACRQLDRFDVPLTIFGFYPANPL
ncbi:hypothetical protein EW026_g3872 [Hermanssonia centrifuga]|uniref:Uncharacterized protein n=1 Tax=Hermanssonia centrifuga TaxID=98765 RepID=A0A4S4KIW9_9APHY|nr:hypothetical protein EW026_g3872 [Hermanssonia centrifuga]